MQKKLAISHLCVSVKHVIFHGTVSRRSLLLYVPVFSIVAFSFALAEDSFWVQGACLEHFSQMRGSNYSSFCDV